MPFVTAEDGVRIHYEVEGTEGGIPLVLLHGFTGRLEAWREAGYIELLRDRFRIVLVDARGHGESDKPIREEDYDWRARSLDVVAAMRDAGLEEAHLWGYSMGGQIALSVAIYAPQRFRSISIGGASSYGARDSAIRVGVEEFWANVQSRPGAHREAWQAAYLHSRKFGGAVQALKKLDRPFLLYTGTGDAFPRRGVTEFVGKYGAQHFTVPNRDHRGALYDAAAEVVPRVTAFIEGVEAAST